MTIRSIAEIYDAAGRPRTETLEQLDAMDDAELRDGYRDGLDGEPEPGGNRSDSYFHGWCMGRSDKGLLHIDGIHTALVSQYVARGKWG